MNSINIITANSVINFAAEELKKYILMMDKSAEVSIDTNEGDISLGLLSDFNLSEDGVEDPWMDDLIDIKIEKGIFSAIK